MSTTLEEKVNAIAGALDQLFYEISTDAALPDDFKMNVQDISKSFYDEMGDYFE